MTNIEALKNLYVALGGSAEDVANLDSNAAIINLLGNVAGGGGASGGGLVVNGNYSGDQSTCTLDKTFAEIESALMAGHYAVVVTVVGEAKTATVVTQTAVFESTYTVAAGTQTFNASGPDGYPVWSL